MTKQTCPYCSKVLDQPVKRKKKCPHCGEYITFRQGELLTEDEAKVENWMTRLERFRVTKRDYEREREALEKQFNAVHLLTMLFGVY
jgi:uncharacterized Zn finger protein (UPF0148 family)